jgi:hypothetical protein
MGQISAIDQRAAGNGTVELEITYTHACQDEFIKVVTQEIPPISPAAPTVAVGVLLDTNPAIHCIAASSEQTVKAELPAISGTYQLRPIER